MNKMNVNECKGAKEKRRARARARACVCVCNINNSNDPVTGLSRAGDGKRSNCKRFLPFRIISKIRIAYHQ